MENERINFVFRKNSSNVKWKIGSVFTSCKSSERTCQTEDLPPLGPSVELQVCPSKILFPKKLRQIDCFLVYENIYFIVFFFQSQPCKYHKIGEIAKNAKFSSLNFGVFCNFANFELFALLGLSSTKKCVILLSSSKNTRKMTVIRTLMARLAYTRKIVFVFETLRQIFKKGSSEFYFQQSRILVPLSRAIKSLTSVLFRVFFDDDNKMTHFFVDGKTEFKNHDSEIPLYIYFHT